MFVDRYEGKVKRAIKKFKLFSKEEKIGVAVSGGKDSVACAVALRRLGYDIEMFHVDLGIGEFSEESRRVCKDIAEKFDIPLRIYSLKELFGYSIPEIRRLRLGKPICAVCGQLKRYFINKIGRKYDAVATGHNGDDLIEFFFKDWLSQHFDWIQKLKPKIPENKELKLCRKVRPLYFCFEEENKKYLQELGVGFVEMRCPFKPRHKIKEAIECFESRIKGFKTMFLHSLAKVELNVEPQESKLMLCKVCSEPTNQEVCSVCRMKERIQTLLESSRFSNTSGHHQK